MPTDKVKGIMEGDIFMQDQDGNINKIGEITQFENNAADESNDAIDALRYAVESQKTTDTVTLTISKESSRYMQKMLGIQKITRKRFIKLLMGCRIQRNDAAELANIVRKNGIEYSPIVVQAIVEWIIKNLLKKEEE